MDATFELHGFQPWGLVPAVLFCGCLAYLAGAGLERGGRWWLSKYRRRR